MTTLWTYIGLGVLFSTVCIVADTFKSKREGYKIAWRWLPVSFVLLAAAWPLVAVALIVISALRRGLDRG